MRFDGEDRTAPVIDHKEYDGDLFAQLRCLEKIKEHIRTVTLPDGRQAREYPEEVIREIVINAIMHRDYDSASPIYAVTQPKFETDEEEIEWLLKKEGNEEIEPLLAKLERKARERTAEQVRQAREEEARRVREEEAIKAAEAVRQAREEEAARAAEAVAEKARQVREEEAARATKRALYAILNARRLVISEAVRVRIESCNDADQLTAWIARAATATSTDDAVNE